jgi:hypothetical protein
MSKDKFIILAACTGLRKTAILAHKWEGVKLDVEFPYDDAFN